MLILRRGSSKVTKHIVTLNIGNWNKEDDTKGCGECQTSCQSACKTSCTVGNQVCLQETQKK